MTALLKKGDLGDCGNYRPISLACIGYKLFAIIILNRMKSAGAEDRIWKSQFGFKSGCGTSNALLFARRVIEQNVAGGKKNPLILLALDWAKAFDSINLGRLIHSLRCFGVPEAMVQVIGAIYSDRSFYVRMEGCDSDWKQRKSGIV